MTFALEPMVNAGGWRTKVLDDRWTVITADSARSAHFEHTLAITKNGPEIMTRL
jgi:methionyl aminopeptidase